MHINSRKLQLRPLPPPLRNIYTSVACGYCLYEKGSPLSKRVAAYPVLSSRTLPYPTLSYCILPYPVLILSSVSCRRQTTRTRKRATPKDRLGRRHSISRLGGRPASAAALRRCRGQQDSASAIVSSRAMVLLETRGAARELESVQVRPAAAVGPAPGSLL